MLGKYGLFKVNILHVHVLVHVQTLLKVMFEASDREIQLCRCQSEGQLDGEGAEWILL